MNNNVLQSNTISSVDSKEEATASHYDHSLVIGSQGTGKVTAFSLQIIQELQNMFAHTNNASTKETRF